MLDFLKDEKFDVTFSQLINFERIIEKECYKALKAIKEIVQNEEIEDADCFFKIEKIVCLFEEKTVCLFESMGIDCGCRHDF